MMYSVFLSRWRILFPLTYDDELSEDPKHCIGRMGSFHCIEDRNYQHASKAQCGGREEMKGPMSALQEHQHSCSNDLAIRGVPMAGRKLPETRV